MPINHARHRRRLLLPLVSALLLLTSCGVLVDRSGPEVSISLGTGSEGEVVVTARARDPESGVASLRLYRLDDGDGALLSEASGGDGGAEAESALGRGLEVTALVEAGTQEVAAVATNGVGKAVRVSKVVGSGPVGGAPDEDAPAVNIVGVTPAADGAVGRGQLSVAYAAHDDMQLAIVSLYVSVNGGEFGLFALHEASQAFLAGAFQVDGSVFALGQTLQFSVTARDAAGNEASATSGVFTVRDAGPDLDVQDPSVTAYGLSPVTMGQIERSELALRYMARDDRGLALVRLEHSVNGDEFVPVEGGVHAGLNGATFTEGTFTIPGIRYEVGDSVRFRVVAEDLERNAAEDVVGPVEVASIRDSAPVVAFSRVTPSVAGFLNRERVTIEYVANDNAGLERVDLFVSVEGGERKLWSQQPVTGRTYQGSFAVDLNSPDFAYGLEIAFILEAVDAAGNLTTVTAPAYTLVDREPPVIEFISPLGSFEGSFVSVSFTVADNDELAEVALLIDGAAVSPITNSHGSNFYHYGWHVTSVEAGLHTLTAVAVDASGNVATQTVVTDIRAEE